MIEPILGKLGAGKVDAREHRLFRSLDVENSGEIRVADLLDVVDRVGLSRDDDRIADCLQAVQGYGLRDRVAYEEFCAAIRPNILLVEQALQGNMIIPDFQAFSSRIQAIYEQTSENRTGEVASYIPQLARVDPNRFGVSLCSIDGQRYSVGDARVHFSVQSSCKPMNYCLALEEHGEDGVHTYVGREPSGRDFNELTLNDAGKPHNPMINAGAIMCTSLIRQDLNSSERFDYLLGWWEAMCGNQKVGFSNSVYQSERSTADRNFALGYYMREHRAFPEGTDLLETLEFYFQCCSIEVNAECMAVLAATLANGGVCPTTGERILKTRNVQHCLSLMCSCGMYDFSGEFAFAIGLPAKSSVSGVLMVVIPNVLGLCVWSPTLDANGNSVRGIEFCRELVESFSFHNYDSLTGVSEKLDPRLNWIESKAEKVDQLIWAASKGDIGALHRLIVRGYDQDGADYDRRTPLHLAAAQGQEHVVRYFIENGAKLDPQDRWGGMPLDDARRHGQTAVVELLREHGAETSQEGDDLGQPAVEGVDAPAFAETPRIVELIYAASEGDLVAIQRLVARGINLSGADYDRRTPLHLAAAEGREHVVQYFIDQEVELSPLDRWGGTPLDDASRHGHARVEQLLENHGAQRGQDEVS